MRKLLFAGLVAIGAGGLLIAQSNLATSQSPYTQKPVMDVQWQIEEVTDNSVPPVIVVDRRAQAPNGLSDGRVAVNNRQGADIAQAWYSEPTTRYAHAVLGDGVEAGALRVRTPRGETYTFRLPSTEVFEDITPRLADLDGDGTTEVITILSAQGQGGSVAVFGLNGNAFIKKAQSPFIGRGNRWLNIAGINQYTGNRTAEIAIVETPHLAGLFKLYRYSRNSDRLVATRPAPGFSNHQIGSRALDLSGTALVNEDRVPDLILPSLDRGTLFAITMAGGNMNVLTRIELPARVNRNIAVEGSREDLKITVGLDNGKIYRITRQ